MQAYMMHCIYKDKIEQWYQEVKRGEPVSKYWQRFLKNISEDTKVQIIFDDMVAVLIQFLMLHSAYHHMSKNILMKISKFLREMKFIGKIHLYQIQQLQKTSILNRIAFIFDNLKFKTEKGQITFSGIKNQWEDVVFIKWQTYWNLVDVMKIQNPVILKFKKISDKKVLSEIILILHPPKCDIGKEQKTQQKVDQQGERRIKKTEEIPAQSRDLQKTTALEEKNIPVQSNKLAFKKVKENKIEKVDQYHLRFKTSNIVDQELTKLAFSQSLFMNRKNHHIVKSITGFLLRLKHDLFSDPCYELEIFGSLKSQLALKGEYDIDITYRNKVEMNIKREQSRGVLLQIKRKLSPFPLWLKYIRFLDFDGLPIPLLQLEIYTNQFERTYQISNIDKIDVTAGNDTAVINSQIISQYAKKEQIHIFCLLVKLWAKSCNVINKFQPMMGLSSYGVILMCLYFLMETKQIPFLNVTEHQIRTISIGSITPNLSHYHIESLSTNFKNFLKFYKANGIFHTERKIICLLGNCNKARHYEKQNIIFNMYDFIDNSNPGRLSIEHRNFIFRQFEKAYDLMETNKMEKILSIFESPYIKNH